MTHASSSADVFVSYSSADRDRAKRLAEALESQGCSVWWDRHIAAGQTFDEVIEQALDRAFCVVVLWSAASVKSDWVKTEAADAVSRGMLVPALIDKVKIPLEFRRLQAANLTQWDGSVDDAEFQLFVQAVKAEVQHNQQRPPKRATSVGISAPTASDPATLVSSRSSTKPAGQRPAPEPQRPGVEERRQGVPGDREQRPVATPSPQHEPVVAETVSSRRSSTTMWAAAAVAVSALIVASVIWFSRDAGLVNAPADTTVEDAPVVAVPREPSVATAARDVEAPEAEPAPAPAAPVMVAIPDLRGQTVERATELLADAGLVVGSRTDDASNDANIGTVLAQKPDSTQQVTKGSPVDLTVAARRAVPPLTGIMLREAQQTLVRLGLTPRIERVRAPAGERDGQVLGQQPAAGVHIEPGGETVLTVASVAPKTLPGGERLFETGGRRCVEVCTRVGLTFKNRWNGKANTCTCD
jgi:hypothetical protein